MRVNEIFYSIQGESLNAGRPCVFVRLTGCNLRCSYCDTRYAYTEGEELSIGEVISRTAVYGSPLVEITGGEPLLQGETPGLISSLLDSGHEVMLETNGSLDISCVDHRCMRIVDYKLPSSGEQSRMDSDNFARLGRRDQVKFVIGTREDYDYARKAVSWIPTGFPPGNLLFSPVSGKISPRRIAEWMLNDRVTARLHLQLHKVVWPGRERGV